jgi:hypothetical protein
VRRLVTFTVAWLFAAVVATTAAWQGVALVTHEVTDERAPPLAASEVQSELQKVGPATTTSTAGTPPASTTTTTTTTAAPSVTETYRLDGGTTTIEFSPTGVRAVSAVPNPGFGVKKSEPEGTGWRVEFESDGHRSRIDAWWDGGPQIRSREDPR